ncbi:MAG: response regulator, partial [Anaerococcus sp.]|nr:response regulator [Anaerococcus sp.]
MKVLIVEDERKLLRLLKEGLDLLGYVTDVAKDGEEALDLAYVECYDIIILDINLPKKDGFEVLRDIRQFDKE